MSDSAPAYRGHVLNIDALRLVALHKEGRIEEILANRKGKLCLYAHLRTYTQPTQLIAAVPSLQPTPSSLCLLS